MTEQYVMTAEGVARLREELAHLKGFERDVIAKRLRTAIQMGDLAENADYHKAKEDQGFLEGRIQELEFILKNVIIADPSQFESGTVQIGTRVTVQEEDNPPDIYYLVGAKEAEPRKGKISNDSPVGSALIGKRVGDTAIANTPGGTVKLKILQIE